MGRYAEIRDIEKRVRASKIYADWVLRNRAPACLLCDSNEKLHVHHVTELYHILLGLWKLYGDWEAVFNHAVTHHHNDECDNVTLCSECHTKMHPAKHTAKVIEPQQIALWCALPRHLELDLRPGKKHGQGGSVGLIAFQTIIGIGWYIMNHGAEDRIVTFKRRNFARLIGKTPGTSFNKSFDFALHALTSANVIIGFLCNNDDIEIHMSPDYMKRMEENPWFFPLEECHTSSMMVLTLRWLMTLQSKRKGYRIGRAKLAVHLGLLTATPVWMDGAVTKAVEQIGWVKVGIQDDIYHFTIRRRGATPIHSLRAILRDAL
jgi:hypothetical protein